MGFQAWQRRRLHVKELRFADALARLVPNRFSTLAADQQREFRRRASAELRAFSEDSATQKFHRPEFFGLPAHAPFDSGASIARIKTSRVTNGDGRGKDAPEVTKDDMEIVSALHCAGRQGRTRTIRFVVRRGNAAELRRSCAADRRAERVLLGVDSREFPPSHRDGVQRRAAAIARRSSFTSTRQRPKATANPCKRP